jgi:hypothetical protein
LEALGFELERISGSHHFFAHADIPELVNLQELWSGQAVHVVLEREELPLGRLTTGSTDRLEELGVLQDLDGFLQGFALVS